MFENCIIDFSCYTQEEILGINLIRSICRNSKKDFSELLKDDLDIHAEYFGWTPIFWSTAFNKKEMVEYILKNCGDISKDEKDNVENYIIELVVKYNCVEAAKTLLEHNIKINICDGFLEHPFFVASEYNSKEEVELLINDFGIDIETHNKYGTTALFYAATGNSIDVIRLLIEKGININKAEDNGYTALMVAAESNSKEVVIELLKNNVDVAGTDVYGETARDKAFYEGNKETVEILENFGK